MKSERLYYLTQDMDGVSHFDQAADAIEAGVAWLQVRSKSMEPARLLETARRIVREARGSATRIIINDHVDIALESGAHGVHLGREDAGIGPAREILGRHAIIGGTANTPEDALEVFREGADYVGLGPFRFTRTKAKLDPVLGLEGIRNAALKLKEANADLPVFAIGGIQAEDIHPILDTGIHGIAVSSAVNFAPDRKAALRKFLDDISAYVPGAQTQKSKWRKTTSL